MTSTTSATDWQSLKEVRNNNNKMKESLTEVGNNNRDQQQKLAEVSKVKKERKPDENN